jgi:ATP-dependent RNA helicase DeaD
VYVHRTGRTGRAGKAGTAISLVSGLDIGNFRYLQQVNKIEIAERKLPSDAEVTARLGERISVKVEQEVRALADREQRAQIERFIPIVKSLAGTEDGVRDLAALCAFYLREHRPETTVTEGAEKKDERREETPGEREKRSGSRSPRGGRKGGSRRGGSRGRKR